SNLVRERMPAARSPRAAAKRLQPGNLDLRCRGERNLAGVVPPELEPCLIDRPRTEDLRIRNLNLVFMISAVGRLVAKAELPHAIVLLLALPALVADRHHI